MRPVFPADSPQEVETRVLNNFSQAGRPSATTCSGRPDSASASAAPIRCHPQFEPTARMIAKHGWLLQQHSITLKENDFHLEAFRSIAREHPIDRLRWSIIHLQSIDDAQAEERSRNWAAAPAPDLDVLRHGGGPPFRRIVDSGIRAGVGTDSTNVSALDPWLSLFYMTTGRNVAGMLTNDGQQVSRVEALRCIPRARRGSPSTTTTSARSSRQVRGPCGPQPRLPHRARADDSTHRIGADARRQMVTPGVVHVPT